MIYLDNAATSGQKPESVYQAVDRALRTCSGNPGRSGHARSLAAGGIVADARTVCARFFGAASADEIAFTANATAALNTAIYGVVRPGGHIITSSLEHNSVSRPIEHLKTLGCTVTVLPASIDSCMKAWQQSPASGSIPPPPDTMRGASSHSYWTDMKALRSPRSSTRHLT